MTVHTGWYKFNDSTRVYHTAKCTVCQKYFDGWTERGRDAFVKRHKASCKTSYTVVPTTSIDISGTRNIKGSLVSMKGRTYKVVGLDYESNSIVLEEYVPNTPTNTS